MRRLWLVVVPMSIILLMACSGEASNDEGRLNVVVTTEIIGDLTRQVGGERVSVSSVVPPGGDPHSYEPTPADARKVAQADLAFTNHLLLEDHALIKLFDTNVPQGRPNISLAEVSEQYGAHLIPFVEDVSLDVLWLGLAVRGEGPSRTSDVRLTATALDGPGDLVVYVTSALGVPEIYFNSRDGLDAADSMTLPPGAHTHVNWDFTKPGVYNLTLSAVLEHDGQAQPLGEETFTFAVGVNTASVAGSRQVINEGHADLAVDLSTGRFFVCTAALSCAQQVGDVPAANAIMEVSNKAIVQIPNEPAFSFLGAAGSEIWELPQAVLGKHVHGVIDPHVWGDVKNAAAFVNVIADTLVSVDPEGKGYYESNRDAYLSELAELDRYVGEQISRIPRQNRSLITTHDAFGYLAYAYEMSVAGFVVPNPAQEPSALQVTRLTETIRNLRVPAVFAEPNLHARASVLRQVAKDQNIQVCKLYGDAFDPEVHSYVEMMRHNAEELRRCLGGGN